MPLVIKGCGCSAPFLHLHSPASQSGNSASHSGQHLPTSVSAIRITIHGHVQRPASQVVLDSVRLAPDTSHHSDGKYYLFQFAVIMDYCLEKELKPWT